jgi:hypothetical protein
MTPGGQGGARPDSLDSPGEHGEDSLICEAAHPPTGAAGDWPDRPRAQPVPTLKLAELLMVILDCRPRLPLAAAAALVREPCAAGTLVRVVFLDAQREPLPVDADTLMATTYLAGELDDDLAAAFGDRSVVILR